MLDIFHIAVMCIIFAFLLWLILYTIFGINPRTRKYTEIGGGSRIHHTDSWSEPTRLGIRERFVGECDAKFLHKMLRHGGELSLEELEALMNEAPYVIGDRLKRLETAGFVAKTSTGRYTLTEKGRKLIELYRERLLHRRKEKEILEERY